MPSSASPRLRNLRHESLAVFYGLVERPDEAERHLVIARGLGGETAATYLAILEAAILGEADKAEELLTRAVAAAKIARSAVRRDPNLAILFEPAQIEALAA